MLMSTPWLTASAFGGTIAIILAFITARRRVHSSRLPYPPGPKPFPVIGNALHISTSEPWLTYTAWQKIFGDLIRIRLIGMEFIIINSVKAARALLDQRSTVYSDRPSIVHLTHTILGIEWSTDNLSYGSELRSHRKLYHHALRADSSLRQREIYLRRSRVLLADLLNDSQGFVAHIKGFVTAIVMGITYGYEVEPENDPYVSTITELTTILERELSAERAVILSALPFLMHIPAWFPGAQFKRNALYSRKLAQRALKEPFDFVKSEIAAGTASQSLVFDCLKQVDDEGNREVQESQIKAVAATAFIAGFGTTTSTLHTFILAMVLYPEVQVKAQAEIDTVIGSTRLPCFEDRPSLPYIEAILREVLRWNPTLPLALPHATSKDDIFDGYFIRKGACVVINAWAMSRNEEKYPDPDEFRPERYFTPDGSLSSGSILNDPLFGFGRRICPGRFAAESMMWAAIVSILATFRIEKAKGADGHEIDVKKQFTVGMSIHPVPFRCAFVCRSAQREKILRET